MASAESQKLETGPLSTPHTMADQKAEGAPHEPVGGDLEIDDNDTSSSGSLTSGSGSSSSSTNDDRAHNTPFYAEDYTARLRRQALRIRKGRHLGTRYRRKSKRSNSNRSSSMGSSSSRSDIDEIERFETNKGTSQALKNIWSAIKDLRRLVNHLENSRSEDDEEDRKSTQKIKTKAKSSMNARAQDETGSDCEKIKDSEDHKSGHTAETASSDVVGHGDVQGDEATMDIGGDKPIAEEGGDMTNVPATIESEGQTENVQPENETDDGDDEDSTSEVGDDDEELGERVFELKVQYFHQQNTQQLTEFYDDEAFTFIKARWDKLGTAGELSKFQKATIRVADVAPNEFDLLEIMIDSPLFVDFMKECVQNIVGDSAIADQAPMLPNQGTLSFYKPFRWLIQHHNLLKRKLEGYESNHAIRQSTTHQPSDVEALSRPESSVAVDSSPPDEPSPLQPPELDLRAQLQYLLNFLHKHLSKHIDRYEDARAGRLKKITFDDLWMLYEPGGIIYTPRRQALPTAMRPEVKPGSPPQPPSPVPLHGFGRKNPQAYKVISVVGGRPLSAVTPGRRESGVNMKTHAPLKIMCYHVDLGEKRFDCVTDMFVMRPFDGEKAITELASYPLVYATYGEANGKDAMREFLRARGKSFVEVSEASHKLYEGTAWQRSDEKEEIDTPVIIDFALTYQYFPYTRPPFCKPDLTYFFNMSIRSADQELFEIVVCNSRGQRTELYWDLQNRLVHRAREVIGENVQSYPPVGSEAGYPVIPKIIARMEATGDILLLPGTVHAFALRNRKWVTLDLTLVQETQFEDGWNDLIIPPTHKDMVRAVVENHAAGSRATVGMTKGTTEVDIVRGKGKGCIILLHGEPGVGKTSTAECVAAFTKRPLFPITCGDIGYEPDEVEKNLQKHFTLAHKWGCVMLLDEADVFLAKRNRHDIKRNGLVSVFLRILEYYPGILFLTTNRVGSFDDAFRSRLHLTLYYPKLNKKQTIQIFEMNLRRAKELSEKRVAAGQKGIEIHEDKIVKFAKRNWETLSWNGRQIRNAFQTAIALAEFDIRDSSEKLAVLGKKQFKTIAKTSKEFDDYLYLTHGGVDEATNARRENVRWDYEIEPRPDKKPELVDSSSDEGSSSSRSSESSDDSDSSSGDSSSSDDNDAKRRKSKKKKAKGKDKKSKKSESKGKKSKSKKDKDA